MKLLHVTLFAILGAALCVSGVQADDNYRLGTDDVVRIAVYGHEDLSVLARIAENGTVTVPSVGQVAIGGLSAKQAEATLAKTLAAAAIVKAPQVSVFVEQYASSRVLVLGKVNRPGTYTITRGSTVADLISAAGGLSEEAADVAVITRRNGNAQTQVDLAALLEGRLGEPDPLVSDGDRIYVPRMERFYVYGEVNRPGAYRVERGMTVMQALAVAGGVTPKGTERGMQIRRTDDAGGEQVVPARGTGQIRPNDVLYVKESLF